MHPLAPKCTLTIVSKLGCRAIMTGWTSYNIRMIETERAREEEECAIELCAEEGVGV